MKKITLILILLLFNHSIFSQKRKGFDKELYQYILNLSEIDYNNYRKNHNVLVDYKNWKKILDRAFSRLSRASALAAFPVRYTIIKNKSFNASAYPGGQFIIHSGTLDSIDQTIASLSKKKLGQNQLRELYISGILAHELSHYYNRHTFKLFKKHFSHQKKSTRDSLKQIKFGQDLELDADKSGFILLAKAGYNTDYFIKILQILNREYQADLKHGKINPYFSSHPSPNKRLARVSREDKNFYQFASKMERIFANIQMGKELKTSLNDLENALILYPKNIDLLRAKAVCLHKLWLKSATLGDLLFRSIIDLPSFRNDMILKKMGKKAIGEKKIPGNIALYKKAKKNYRKVIRKTHDPFFVANYATLLAYSPKKRDEKNAVKYGKRAHKETRGSLITGNNLAVVYYLVKKPEQAKVLWEKLASRSNAKIKNLVANSTVNSKAAQEINALLDDIDRNQVFNKRYVHNSFTPILNLTLYHFYRNAEGRLTRIMSNLYLEYDKTSEWAKFLAESMNMKSRLDKKSQIRKIQTRIKGIGLGSSFKEVYDKWGKHSRMDKRGNTLIYYYDHHDAKIEFRNTSVTNIELSPGSDLKLNQKIKTQMPEIKVDKYFHTKPGREGNYKTYKTSSGKVTIYSEKGIVNNLWLYR